MARAAKNASRSADANGSRTGSSSSTVPAGEGVVARRLRRSADGVAANTSRTVSLNCRRLPNPDAAATAGSAMSVVSSSVRAVWARWARAMASGPAPSSSVITRLRWRSL